MLFGGYDIATNTTYDIATNLTFLLFLDWVAGQAYTELLENLVVYLREHDGGVNLAVAELRKLLKGAATVVVGL